MDMIFSEAAYEEMLGKLFVRFPSFQKTGAGAYKPGIANMEFADQMMGHPHRNYDIIHVAGTNGKGSVSNMLASVLASCGQRVGLYTSPHILDFRERMRVVEIATGDALAMTCEGIYPGAFSHGVAANMQWMLLGGTRPTPTRKPLWASTGGQ